MAKNWEGKITSLLGSTIRTHFSIKRSTTSILSPVGLNVGSVFHKDFLVLTEGHRIEDLLRYPWGMTCWFFLGLQFNMLQKNDTNKYHKTYKNRSLKFQVWVANVFSSMSPPHTIIFFGIRTCSQSRPDSYRRCQGWKLLPAGQRTSMTE